MRNKIVKWFIENNYELFKDMESTSHNSENNINRFHAEGSIWTHTMMVMQYIDCKYSNDEPIKEKLLLVGLLHDIGKPAAMVYDKEKNKKIFRGHEGISAYKAIDILMKYKIEFETISERDINEILSTISTHGTKSEHELNIHFSFADKNGAIRNVDEDMFGNYDNQKYIDNLDENKEEVIILTGLPCPGKSTLINILNEDEHYIVLSRDNLLMQTVKSINENEFTYNQAYDLIHSDDRLLKMFNNLFEDKISELAKLNVPIIIDMTMMSLKSRRTMMAKFGKRNYKSVVLMTSLDLIKKRNEIRSLNGKSISDDVNLLMMKSFIMPVKEEGFSTITIIKDCK